MLLPRGVALVDPGTPHKFVALLMEQRTRSCRTTSMLAQLVQQLHTVAEKAGLAQPPPEAFPKVGGVLSVVVGMEGGVGGYVSTALCEELCSEWCLCLLGSFATSVKLVR